MDPADTLRGTWECPLVRLGQLVQLVQLGRLGQLGQPGALIMTAHRSMTDSLALGRSRGALVAFWVGSWGLVAAGVAGCCKGAWGWAGLGWACLTEP